VVFLFTGAFWATADRFAWQPLGFDPLIVLLTAVHFHYAGFALTWAGKNIISGGQASLKKYLITGVLAGIPLTALGITGTHGQWTPLIEVFGVLITVCAGMTIGLSHLTLAIRSKAALKVRMLWGLAGSSLIIGMTLVPRALSSSHPKSCSFRA